MAVFAEDNFTDTDGTALTSHTPDDGGSWTKHTLAGSGSWDIRSNRIRSTGSTGTDAHFYHSGTPDSAEYDVEADIVRLGSTTPSATPGVTGRHSTSAETFYFARYNASPTFVWQLFKRVSGTFTLLGSYSQSFSVGQSRTVKLEIRDTAKKVYIDGTERISSTDNAITAAGKAGIRDNTGQATTTGYHIDNYVATDLSSSGTNPPPHPIAAGVRRGIALGVTN